MRVHKMLGWGLTDVQSVNGTITDPRINPDGPVHNDTATVDEFTIWFEDHYADAGPMSRLPNAAERSSLSDCFVFDPEYGLPVLCIRLLSHPRWERYDDIIDWVDETYGREPKNENGRPWVEVLPDNPYPYMGAYMDDRVGTRLGPAVLPLRWGLLNNPDEVDDDLAVRCGFASHADAVAHLAPCVPDEIRAMCEFTRVFHDPATILQLRPMIYVWWS